ncbi:MAG TPA: hypothetical protein VHE30_07890 [Polyangiaceae bacterium]|nr:hypothetical protein [Polyangiaceae bacterium]
MTTPAVLPLTIARDNCVALVGRSWRATMDLARELGVPVRRVGRVALIPAVPFLEAIERAGANEPADEPEVSEVDELAKLRAKLGKRRRRT